MRLVLAAAMAAGLCACATAPRDEGPVVSWGKAGVPLETYWLDAAECTARGAQASSNIPVATHKLDSQRGPIGEQNRNIAADESIIALNDIIFRARQNQMMQERADDAARQEVINACLTERGYRQFRLTAEQQARLAELDHGSVARRRYLHSLGSNAAVLSAQAL